MWVIPWSDLLTPYLPPEYPAHNTTYNWKEDKSKRYVVALKSLFWFWMMEHEKNTLNFSVMYGCGNLGTVWIDKV